MDSKDEFLNPKSMLTPAIAGGIVMLISNTLATQFDIAPRWSALVLSFVLGLILLFTLTVSIWQRIVYYVVNSLVIFSMAIGTNQVGRDTVAAKQESRADAEGLSIAPDTEVPASPAAQPAPMPAHELATPRPEAELATPRRAHESSPPKLMATPERAPILPHAKRKDFFRAW